MLGRKKKGPSRPTEAFAHTDGCTIVTADPGFQPEWAGDRRGPLAANLPMLERRHLRATRRHAYSAHPLHPVTFRHGPSCEHREVGDPGIVRAILRVYDREGHWWVECLTCAYGWQTRTMPRRARGDERGPGCARASRAGIVR